MKNKNKKNKQEKRTYLRKPSNFKVDIKRIGAMMISDTLDAESVDVAGGGVSFTYRDRIKNDVDISLVLHVPVGNIKAEGNVIRCEKIDKNEYKIVVSFHDMSEENVKAIYLPA